MSFKSRSLLLTIGILLCGFSLSASENTSHKVAFLADVHFHDVFASFSDNSYQGVSVSVDGDKKRALIRSMKEQLNSTRLFNENYFVFKAALEDLVKRGVRLVALPGDFSDDGQPIHIRGLVKILKEYETKHGMQFFSITGNHDPVRPFTRESGDKGFLQADGSEINIYSRGHENCESRNANVECSNDMLNWGYQEIMAEMAEFGFMPKPDYLLYETPFTRPEYSATSFEERQWNWCEPQHCMKMPDSSYLVEPVAGFWLLAIDANVYVPREPSDPKYKTDPFLSSSNAGYNALIKYKPQLIDWIADVVKRAKEQGKKLMTFSHYPMADFDESSTKLIESVFAKGKLQQRRIPTENTSKILADTGLQVHVGGHLHINDTGMVRGNNGNVLYNIQAPTLAAYRPGYKILEFTSQNEISVETIMLSDVPNYDRFFELYAKEHKYLKQHEPASIWSESILSSNDYQTFTDHHLQQVTNLRFLKKDWPVELSNRLQTNTFESLVKSLELKMSQPEKAKFMSILNLPAVELVYDFYRLRGADTLALVDNDKLSFYRWLNARLATTPRNPKVEVLSSQVFTVLKIIHNFSHSESSNNFKIKLL